MAAIECVAESMSELNGKTSPLKESPEDSLLGYRMKEVELKLDESERRTETVELKVEHTVEKDYLERAIGDMKVGIAEAVGDMKVGIVEAVGEMRTSVAQTKWEMIKWILGGTTTLIGLGLFAYKLFFSNPPT